MIKSIPHKQYAEIKALVPAVISYIRDRLGIVTREQQQSELEKILVKACEKFQVTPKAYLAMLMSSTKQSPLLEHLVSAVTVGETYFFRDKRQMQLLQQTLLPNLIQSKRQQNNLSLRIWSAGCASGEEIYTIAMLLAELLPDIEHWTLQLLGTDINETALKKAIAGVYTEWSMRSIAAHWQKKYFIQQDKHYYLQEHIRRAVTFNYLNLTESVYPSMLNGTNAQDLILCRNVLIYFDQVHIAEVMKKFSAALLTNAWLILGASDPVVIQHTPFIFHQEMGLVFSRGELPLPKLALQKDSVPLATRPAVSLPPRTRIKADKNATLVLLEQLVTAENWQAVLPLITEQGTELPVTLQAKYKAMALANMGKLTEALVLLTDTLALEPTNRDCHFLSALVLLELGDTKAAEFALRKTLFIDHQYVFAHYQLGLLLVRNKQWAQGLKSLHNALAITRQHESDLEVPGAKSMTYGSLVDTLTHEIDLYQSLGKKEDTHENAYK